MRPTPDPGKVERRIIAKRRGRLAGGGLLAESQKRGRETDWRDGPVPG